jgi:hypothetical protein
MNFAPLTATDMSRLEASWISDDLIQAAGIQRVDSETGGQLVGRNGRGDYAGLIIPYKQPWDPKNTVLQVLRRDHPDFETVDGKVKEKGKYLVAPGSPQRLYFGPSVSSVMLADISIPVLLVEGEKKTLAASRLAWHGLSDTAEKPLFVAIGLRGVYGFRGRVGKETAPDGSRVDVSGVIPDFARVAWKARRVFIWFDANIRTHRQVKQARQDLTLELEGRGARVHWVNWPTDTPSQVNGPDDFLAIVGPEKALKLLEESRPAKPTAKQQGDCPREFEAIAEDRYRLSLNSIGVTFEIDRLRRDRHELIGELSVKCDLPGARTFDGALSTADFNLSSARSRTDRAKLLASRALVSELDWVSLVEEFCQRVLSAERAGRPVTDLREIERPTPNDAIEVEGISLPKRHPAIGFGDGGAAKSLTALYLLGRLAQQGMAVALFDWELAGEDHRDRIERLFGTAMPKIYYARCERALVHESDRLKRIVRELNISYAVYDSVAFACDGPPESAEVASCYFRAVRQVGVGSFHIAHITKGESADKKPFGSAFWHNGARSTWYIKLADASSDGQTLSVGLFNRKTNLGRLAQPTGFKIVFNDDRTIFTRQNPADNPDLAVQMTIRQRMFHLLQSGSMSPEAVAEEIEADVETVRRTVRRYKQVFTILDGGKVALLDRRAS